MICILSYIQKYPFLVPVFSSQYSVLILFWCVYLLHSLQVGEKNKMNLRYFHCHAFYWKADNFSMPYLTSQSNSSQTSIQTSTLHSSNMKQKSCKTKNFCKAFYKSQFWFGLYEAANPTQLKVCLLFCFSNLSKKTCFQNPKCYFKIFLWGNNTRLWAGKKIIPHTSANILKVLLWKLVHKKNFFKLHLTWWLNTFLAAAGVYQGIPCRRK